MAKYDFAGWAARNDVRCSDGTVIRNGCFADQDGEQVPLVWMHNHNEVGQVLGHAILRNVPGKGVRIEGFFNETEGGKQAKELVKNKDISALSIFANHLRRGVNDSRDILHGQIKEVSLVIGGADPTAQIDTILAHGDDCDDQAIIWGFGHPEIAHADEDEEEEDDMANKNDETVKDVFDTLTDKQKKAVAIIVDQIIKDQKVQHNDDEDPEEDEVDDEDDTDEDADDDVEEADEEDLKPAPKTVGKKNKKGKIPPQFVKHANEEEDDSEDSDDEETVKDVYETLNEKQKKVVAFLVGKAVEDAKGGSVKHADDEAADDDSEAKDGETVKDVYETFNEKQKKVVAFLVGKALEDAKKNGNSEEEDNVKHNVFDGEARRGSDVISHDDMMNLIRDAKTMGGGSLKEAFQMNADNGTLAHADLTAGTDYGMENVDYLFPDARAIENTPAFVSRNMDWVDGVLNATHKTPFARVKSIAANITEEEARARGYIKGKYKKEEVFSLLKRATYPQTIYKKQRLDKEDIADITEFDVVAWLKTEMQLMLREEVARAILIGDGRTTDDGDKINEQNIRPVATDSDFFTIKVPVEISANATDDEKAKALMKAQLKSRKEYKGSGNLTFYTTDDVLTTLLLQENTIGERLYKSEAEIASAIRVSKIVPVEPMEGVQVEITGSDGSTKTKYDLAGIDVNLADYNIGTNGGAKTEFFDDFDLDFNQQIMLYETRMSGALIKPYSAVCFFWKITG